MADQWEARFSERGGYHFIDVQQGGEGYTVARFAPDGVDDATVDLIVRAVNTHADLVAALRALVQQVEDFDHTLRRAGSAHDAIVANARALLAKLDAEAQR